MNSKPTHQQQQEQWRDALESAITHPEEPLLVERFNDGWGWKTSACPVSVRCIDKQTYIIKGQQAGRQIVNDQIIARLGMALGAPVGRPRIVEISPDLLECEPRYNYLTAGTAHATLFIQNCEDDRDLTKFRTHPAENIPRFASLCVLYGWVLAKDHQFLFEKQYPNRVYSVDHGHFFPGGPNWTQETLSQAPAAELDTRLSRLCSLSRESPEIINALEQLDQVSEDMIIQAVAAPPKQWGLKMEERVTMVEYLVKRQQQLVNLL
ncbi:HipA family kinase [Planktothrix pseudagardhii]|uniref:HipA-like kinase domain-containing protein n=1 Tax=Planktothrix pseudagardhii TaxID=132604 RepID=A0A9W4GAT2_9CYAN|nr:HipA family kinase [Planktothrix pseudagardhii]CAD5981417.1 hypothetical protein NO713_04816 [Planktothrix pseudagardhii]